MRRTILASKLLGTIAIVASFTVSTGAIAESYNGPKISFEQIYANPDDQELNLSYARQQAANGDYISAASALERMLFASPNWDSARLFYALVLYRLDDKQAAMRELDLLESRPLSPKQRRQVKAYRESFSTPKTRQATSGLVGRIAVGVRYDDNAGNALADTFLTFADRDDISAFAQARLQYTNPIGDNGLKFKAGINGLLRRHETFSTADYDTFGANIGLLGDLSNGLSWDTDIQVSQVNISGQKHLTQFGGRVKIKKALSETIGLWVQGTWHDQDYNNLSFTTLEPTRSGDKLSLSTGVIKRLDKNSFISASLGYEDKKTTNAAFAYDGIRLNARFHNGFDNGIYLSGRATYRMLKYDGTSFNNPAPTRREDDHISGRLGIGASLNSLATKIGLDENPSLDNLGLEAGINYTNRSSNNPVLDYKNFGTDIKLIWNF